MSSCELSFLSLPFFVSSGIDSVSISSKSKSVSSLRGTSFFSGFSGVSSKSSKKISSSSGFAESSFSSISNSSAEAFAGSFSSKDMNSSSASNAGTSANKSSSFSFLTDGVFSEKISSSSNPGRSVVSSISRLIFLSFLPVSANRSSAGNSFASSSSSGSYFSPFSEGASSKKISSSFDSGAVFSLSCSGDSVSTEKSSLKSDSSRLTFFSSSLLSITLLSIIFSVLHLGQVKANFLFATLSSSTANADTQLLHLTIISCSCYVICPGKIFHLRYAE